MVLSTDLTKDRESAYVLQIGLYTSRVDIPDNGPGIYREHLVRELSEILRAEDDLSLLHYEESENELYDRAEEIILDRNDRLPSAVNKVLNQVLGWKSFLDSQMAPLSELQLRNENFDVIHFQMVPPRPFWLFESDAVLTTTIHFAARPQLHTDQYPYFERKARKIAISKVLRELDGIFVISEYSKRLHSEVFNVPESKFYVTPNAPPRGFQPTANERVIDMYGLNRPYLFHLSDRSYYKNPTGIIKGFRHAKEKYDIPHRLLIAGSGWSKSIVEELAGEQDDAIEFLGFVDRADLPTIYTQADQFLLPSLSEGLPMAILESLACGTPVVTTADCGLPSQLRDGGKYIEDVSDIAEIGERICDVLSSDTVTSESALEVASGFSWRRTAEKTYSTYRQLLKEQDK